jgi:hypothetical protein
VVADLGYEKGLADVHPARDRIETVFTAARGINDGVTVGGDLVTFDPRPVHAIGDRVFGPARADAGAAPDALRGVHEINPSVTGPVIVGPVDALRRTFGKNQDDGECPGDRGAGTVQKLAAGDRFRTGWEMAFFVGHRILRDSSIRRVRVVALETGVRTEFDIVLGQVVTNVDLGESLGASGQPAVAELAKLPAAADRHVCDFLALLEVDVGGHRTVAQFAPDGRVDPGAMVGELGVVAHRAGLVSEMAHLPGAVFVNRCAPIPAELAPGGGDE